MFLKKSRLQFSVGANRRCQLSITDPLKNINLVNLGGDGFPRFGLIHQVEDDPHQISGGGVDSARHSLNQNLDDQRTNN